MAQGLEPVRLPLDQCYGLVSRYRGKNKKIVRLWEFLNDVVMSDLAREKVGVVKEYKGIEYGREFIRLKGHLTMHYPEAKVKVTRRGARGWSRAVDKERVDDGSYRTPLGRSKMYGGFLVENLCQYLARIVVAYQMIEIAKRYRVVMMTHDEIVFLAKTREAKRALEWAIGVMRTPPDWAPDMPVDAEGGYDSVYSK